MSNDQRRKDLLRKVLERTTVQRFRAQRWAALQGRMRFSPGFLYWTPVSNNDQVLEAECLAQKKLDIAERKAKLRKRSCGQTQSITAGELAAARRPVHRASTRSGADSPRAVAPPAFVPYDMNRMSPATDNAAEDSGRLRRLPSSPLHTSAQPEGPLAVQVPRSGPRVPLGDITDLINNTELLTLTDTGPRVTPRPMVPIRKHKDRTSRRR